MDERKYRDLSIHEMKNMVSAISGYAELIARGIVKDAKAMEMAGKIHSQSKIFSEFLDKKYIFELLIGELYQPEWKSSDLGLLLEETLTAKKITEDKLLINRTPVAAMVGDQYLLKEMIGHLLDNALKYNRGTSPVEVSVRQAEDEVVIEFYNEAEELAAEDFIELLEPYYRKDKNKSRKLGSQGMGLPIVSRIVKLHKGRHEFAYEKGRFCIKVYFKTMK